jgi:hypothetical protein
VPQIPGGQQLPFINPILGGLAASSIDAQAVNAANQYQVFGE